MPDSRRPGALIMALDPVCGMSVDPEKAAGRIEHEGTTYFFCSKHCSHAFKADPNRFVKKDSPKKAEPQSARYTCPMHPEIVQIGPGSCPKCGMALVPMEAGVEDDSELRDQVRRLWVSAVLSAPLLFIAMAPMLGFHFEFK
jgi:Cu+-exporting ATPase